VCARLNTRVRLGLTSRVSVRVNDRSCEIHARAAAKTTAILTSRDGVVKITSRETHRLGTDLWITPFCDDDVRRIHGNGDDVDDRVRGTPGVFSFVPATSYDRLDMAVEVVTRVSTDLEPPSQRPGPRKLLSLS